MALFSSYAPPGVYTNTVIDASTTSLFGSSRIPVIIGEGLEYFTQSNKELFRGSSATADDQAVDENISDQVTGLTRTFTVTYTPVTDGAGTGTITNDPTKITVTVDTVPATVLSLTGSTGSFSLQDIPPLGSDVEVTYYFKRGDTLISNEDLSAQIPAYASLTIQGTSSPAVSSSITLTTTLPGATGNNVSIELVAGSPVVDTLAIGGYGTDAITINVTKSDSTTRTVVDLYNLVEAGISTLSAGYLVASQPIGSGVLTVSSPPSAVNLTGGAGPNSNTTFAVGLTYPANEGLIYQAGELSGNTIVDGTNGGVVTTNTSLVTVLVNSSQVTVSSVDGTNGLITLSNAVAYGSSLTVTYYTNTYQNTSDLLPASNVASIVQVGLGPDRADFIQDVDYVLGTDSAGNPVINWGASTTTTAGVNTSGYTAFGATQINTTLIDERMYLQYAGAGDGTNTVFTLPDVPTNGSGLDVVTNDPNKVQVYVGSDPHSALEAGTVRVSRLVGDTATVTLYNPPSSGQKVYANYYRNTLNDHTYTVKVVNPAQSGQGTYTLANEYGYVLPVVSNSTNTVANANFETTGIVWPNAFSDTWAEPNSVDETVTVTFNNDGNEVVILGTQAQLSITFASSTIQFLATTPGVNGNSITIDIDNTTNADPTIVGDAITLHSTGTVASLLQSFPLTVAGTYVGQVTASLITGTGSDSIGSSISAQDFGGGVDQVLEAYSHSYTVTSTAGTSGSHGVGYLDQTYEDATTGLKFTILNPADALLSSFYGYTSLPSPQYKYTPGDTLIFIVSKSAVRYTGSTYFPYSEAQPNNLISIPGLNTSVVTTFGANAGDTAIIATYNKSGDGPTVGEFYYITFTVAKTSTDMELTLYDEASDAYAVYGQPNTTNRLSLGISLLTQNGSLVFGAIQVPKQTGLNVASDSDFIAAIQTLTKNLPGYSHKANVIVPLSTSTTVHQFLSRQLITQATARYKGEAIGFVGYSQYTTAAEAITNATGLANSRMIAIGNPVAGLQITDSLTGVAVEYAVSGEFMAAALAGLNTNPANDVATSLTMQDLVGFTRLLIRYDDSTMNNMASQGLVLLTDNAGSLSIRHYKSTDPSNPITSEPTSTTVTDYTCQCFRSDLKQFIGRKLVDSLVTDITTVCNSRLRSLVSNEIITGYQNLSVTPSDDDPTTVLVTCTFKPMFSLLWISITFTVTTTLS